MIVTPLATFAPEVQFIRSTPMLAAVFVLAALTGGLLLYDWAARQGPERLPLWLALALAAASAACVHILVSYAFEISDYPLTLAWSEASRYYYASLFFSERIYGVATNPTVLHPSRYLLQAVPFLIPDSSLWLHRAWQASLWWALPAITGWLLARRLAPANPYHRWLATLTIVLFLFIGPVYYHLLVPVIVILLGFDTRLDTPRRRWISAAALLFASAWCGISRVNWYPVAGLLAAALFLMEQPVPMGDEASTTSQPLEGVALRLDRAAWLYFLKPVAWTLLGMLVAFLTQLGYITWSGNAADEFTTSFFSDLLWHRLLPNATYPPGLLLAAALVSLPPALILAGKLLERCGGLPLARRLHPLRLLALAVILFVLLAGGLLVSLKIGGGNNLHNIDAYLTLLAVVTVYFAFNGVAPDLIAVQTAENSALNSSRLAERIYQAGVAGLMVIAPLFAILPRGPSEPLAPKPVANDTLKAITEAAEFIHSQGQETLFIGQRHLLTFHYLEDVPLIPDYERVFLMEAAMANNESYLNRFYGDLKRQRYGLIVSEPLSRQVKDPAGNFAAENNAWAKRVSRPILCYYEPVKTFLPTQVQLLTPRADPQADCR